MQISNLYQPPKNPKYNWWLILLLTGVVIIVLFAFYHGFKH